MFGLQGQRKVRNARGTLKSQFGLRAAELGTSGDQVGPLTRRRPAPGRLRTLRESLQRIRQDQFARGMRHAQQVLEHQALRACHRAGRPRVEVQPGGGDVNLVAVRARDVAGLPADGGDARFVAQVAGRFLGDAGVGVGERGRGVRTRDRGRDRAMRVGEARTRGLDGRPGGTSPRTALAACLHDLAQLPDRIVGARPERVAQRGRVA